MSAIGADRKFRHDSLPAAIRGIPENLCSLRAFLRLTQIGHRHALNWLRDRSDCYRFPTRHVRDFRGTETPGAGQAVSSPMDGAERAIAGTALRLCGQLPDWFEGCYYPRYQSDTRAHPPTRVVADLRASEAESFPPFPKRQ
jgi:hypothetical protein